jgi:flagellar FliJ protein
MRGAFRLASVLRARQAQEDAAKSAAARAREAADAAAAAARRREDALHARAVPTDGTARAVIAALTARHSMAAELSAALRMVEGAERDVSDRVSELAEASTRRRSVEKLAERHAAEELHEEQAADQRTIDELAVTDRQRARAREL